MKWHSHIHADYKATVCWKYQMNQCFHHWGIINPRTTNQGAIFDPVLHSIVVEKRNCLLLSMNISTGRAEIFTISRTPHAFVHSTNLSSVTSNVTELLSEHCSNLEAAILPPDISFKNLISKLSLVKISNDWDLNFLLKTFVYQNSLPISRTSIIRVGFAWFSWNLFLLVFMGSQVFSKSFRAIAFDRMEIQLERLYWSA
jgi:hypothetical protein